MVLKGVQLLAEKNGVRLDLGNVKRVDQYISAANDDADRPEPVEVASRLVAHIAHRLPFAKTVTKRFEGKDKNSGIFSDLMALGAQVASLNEDLITEQADAMLSKAVNGNKPQSPVFDTDGIHVDFGEVTPTFIPNDPNNN